jgi:lysophospholipase L1-like esterase
MENKNKSTRRTFIRNTCLTGIATGLQVPLIATAAQKTPEISKGLVFLFQGDSITDGNRGRNTDPNHIMGHGYAFAIASRIGADFPEAGFVFYNRGISGNKIPDLGKRWQTDTVDLKPDVLSILIGINDTAAEVNKANDAKTVLQFEEEYRNLLQQCREQKPDVLFVLGLPFVYPVGKRKDQWQEWKNGTEQRAQVVRKLATEVNAVLIDYPALFDKAVTKAPPEYWIWDGVHPTVFGHELMAREWIKQVGKKIKILKTKYNY